MKTSPHDNHKQHLEQLAAFLRESNQILADWHAYSEHHTDLYGWLDDDDAYARRASLHDADIWKAFNRIRPCAGALVATAEAQLQRLPPQAVQSRWVWQLSVLGMALDSLAHLHDDWLVTCDSLPPSARPGTKVYDDALAKRNAEAWPEIDEWASSGEVLLEIHRAALQAPSELAPAPVRAPAPLATANRTATARR
ncbi:hypothetical protein [Streptomyces sp. bgisy084]|uniref:hypothetical protein n=1 Tax=unclassified Streptomyces TaxID=2593676 RepID=UPI003D74216E